MILTIHTGHAELYARGIILRHGDIDGSSVLLSNDPEINGFLCMSDSEYDCAEMRPAVSQPSR